MQDKLESDIESRAISQIKRIVVQVFQTNPSRAASDIPTPGKYNNSRGGLVNTRNDNDKCFSAVCNTIYHRKT